MSLLVEKQKNPENSEQKIIYITTYHSHTQRIRKGLNTFWPVLEVDKDLSNSIEAFPQITFRKTKSLTDTLCKAIQPTMYKTLGVQGFFTCRKCKACKYSKNCKVCQLPSESKPCIIKKYTSCNTDFAIYALFCPCHKAYIGSTIPKAKKRVLEHLRAIKHGDKQYPRG